MILLLSLALIPGCSGDTTLLVVVDGDLEVPAELDEFADRDPEWRGGAVHAGGRR